VDLDVVVQCFNRKPGTNAGKAWIRHDALVMTVKRGDTLLRDRAPRCSADDKATFDLRVDAAKSFLSYRCKPSEPWVVSHVGATAVHPDCEANGGTGSEPDLAPAKTFLERADTLMQCAVEDKWEDESRDLRTLALTIDFRRASNSDDRTAQLLVRVPDLVLAQSSELWPQAGGTQGIPRGPADEPRRRHGHCLGDRWAEALTVVEGCALDAEDS